MNRTSTRHLVAPELLPGSNFFPEIDFSKGLDAVRAQGFSSDDLELPAELAVVAQEERFIPGLDGAPDVRLLIYTPPGEATGPRPAVCHVHGGGYVLGTADINDISNRAMALSLGCSVVSVDYRLAPETAWPGALEDCYAALTWMAQNAAELGIDPDRIAVAGESAGGGHAAALAIHARNQGGPGDLLSDSRCADA